MFPFKKVPDFKDQVEKEEHPQYYDKLDRDQQKEYLRNRIMQESQRYSCDTSTRTWNLCIILFMLFVLTNGIQLMSILQEVIKAKLGIK